MGAKKKPNNNKGKTLLQNPLKITWADVGQANEESLYTEFLKAFNQLKQKGHKKRGLICGVNSVSRAIECGRIQAVIISSSIKPPHVVSHLIPLSISKKVPIIPITNLDALAKELKIGSLLALGFNAITSVTESETADAENDEQSPRGYLDVIAKIKKLSEEFNKSNVNFTPPEVYSVPIPPITSINSSKPKSDTHLTNKSNPAPEFMELNLGPFPPPSYPKELDNLNIEITDQNSILTRIESLIDFVEKESCEKSGIKRKAEDNLPSSSPTKVLKLAKVELKQVCHGTKKKKNKKKAKSPVIP